MITLNISEAYWQARGYRRTSNVSLKIYIECKKLMMILEYLLDLWTFYIVHQVIEQLMMKEITSKAW